MDLQVLRHIDDGLEHRFRPWICIEAPKKANIDLQKIKGIVLEISK